jgi:hypothetical protein
MLDVGTTREIQKFFRLNFIVDRFEVFVCAKVHCDDDFKAPASSSFYVKHAGPVLDL